MIIDTPFQSAVIYKFKFIFGSNVIDTIIFIDLLGIKFNVAGHFSQ